MKIEFEGDTSYVDQRFNIRIMDLEPFAYCRIDLSMKYSWDDIPFWSYGVFKADDTGVVNLSTMSPIKGSYKGIDSMGLFCGLKYDEKPHYVRMRRNFTKEQITCDFKVKSGKEEVQKTILRRFTSEKVQCMSLYKEFRGEYFYHSIQLNLPCVILLGGSEGDLNAILPMAACLANQGFQVLALQYFNPYQDYALEAAVDATELPRSISCIQMEYINFAIEWVIHENPQSKLYLMGASKGAELALFVASYHKGIHKVVAVAPSAYVNQGINSYSSSWSYQQKQIPFIPYFPFVILMDIFKNKVFRYLNLPQGFWLTFELSRIACLHREEKRIKVENIEGNICLIAGKKDTVWNSVGALKRIKKRLTMNADKKSLWEKNQYHIYKKCGHCFYVPFIFRTNHVFGGSKQENFRGNEDSWKRILDFLHQ